MNGGCDIRGGSGGSSRSTGTSRSLLDRIRANESEAWDRLVALYAPLVFYWCRSAGLQEEDRADVFQEVFQAVAGHIDGFRRDHAGDTFRGWLRTIARNKIHDHFRRCGREPTGAGGSDAQTRMSQVPAPMPLEEEDAERVAERRLFDRALESIRDEFEERTWQAFWLTAVDGGSAKDVATELGMSSGAVRVAKSRVLQRLREELGDLAE